MPLRPHTFRSVLFASPSDGVRSGASQVPDLGEALASRASVILFDLEDTVPENRKDDVRRTIAGHGRSERVWVRINHHDHPAWVDDVAAAAATAGTVMVPKVEEAADLGRVAAALAELGSDADLVALIETARGLANLHEVCADPTGRLAAVCLGIGDLTRDTNTTYTGVGEIENYARCKLIEASAAHGLMAPIDTASLFVGDADYIREECRLAKRMGFGSKLCLTLEDVEIVTEEFGVTAAELAHARLVLEAYEEGLAAGLGQVVAGGTIVDVPTVERAKDVLRAAGEPLS